MFRKLHKNSETIKILFEGSSLNAVEGQTVAAALLSEGHLFFRNSVISGQPRAPYCMMGVCYECMLEIDGQSSQQACLIPVREGMKIRRQNSLKG
jgi:predicted molibdopterin-dependent oxidoreductase YjgC